MDRVPTQASEPAPSIEDLQEMLLALAGCDSMLKIRQQSLWAIKIAIHAALTEGLGGEIHMVIPDKSNKPIEVTFATTMRV